MRVLLSPSPLRAHHAFAAEFDENKPVNFMDATVTKVELINPHSWIHVDVKNARRHGRELGDRSGQSEHPAAARHHEDTLKMGDKIDRRRISVEGRVAPGQRPGSHAAERATAVPRIFRWRRRSVRSAAAWRRCEVRDMKRRGVRHMKTDSECSACDCACVYWGCVSGSSFNAGSAPRPLESRGAEIGSAKSAARKSRTLASDTLGRSRSAGHLVRDGGRASGTLRRQRE